MSNESFLKRKNVIISPKVYFVDAMSGMAQGLFASLLMGTILGTLAKYILMLQFPIFQTVGQFINEIGKMATAVTGAAIGVGIASALGAPMLVIACSAAIGHFANGFGNDVYTAGPLGVFVAVIIAVELGKIVSKETKVDILVTPLVTLSAGYLVAYFTCPSIAVAMNALGSFINNATQLRPFLMGIVVSVVVGIVLTLPISSAAICASIGISGLAGGAALAGCCAQMIGFAVISFRENKWGGVIAQGLGTSMLQMPNIVRHPQIWIPATLASAITGPIATMLFELKCTGVSAGMGTCGLVGPIGAISAMSENGSMGVVDWVGLALVCVVLPAVISLVISEGMRKLGLIKFGQMTLD
ncbi:MAG: PTS sugar transporter subunit IIC [Clostridiales bacterium]|nr:PTS sugar transporter subunit IIC [Clostridiales bacterium]